MLSELIGICEAFVRHLSASIVIELSSNQLLIIVADVSKVYNLVGLTVKTDGRCYRPLLSKHFSMSIRSTRDVSLTSHSAEHYSRALAEHWLSPFRFDH